jgi:predicted hydrolase (HD superfamily)
MIVVGVEVLVSNDSVPSILHCVISSTRQKLSDLSPLVSNLRLHCEDNIIFICTPAALLDVGLQVIVISLAALLRRSRLQLGGDGAPVLGTLDSNNL